MQSAREIERNPKFQYLVRQRRSLGLTLSAIMIVIYFGFILLVAYAPGLIGRPIGAGPTTLGIPLGIAVILAAFVLTGIYVRRANAEFDTLTEEIVRESKS